MIWECAECSRRWQRPLAKCNFCGGQLARREDHTWVVRGFSEVFVPSPGHETVPYFVTLLENGQGERRMRKTFVRPAIGDTIDLAPKTAGDGRSVVAMSRIGYDPLPAVSWCLDTIGPHRLGADTRVLLKPNLVVDKPASTGVVTNPRVTEAIITYLLDHGVRTQNLTVGDGAAIGFDTMVAARKGGTLAVCEQYGLRFVDFNRSEYVNRKVAGLAEGLTYKIAREVFEQDLIINIPVVKTHFQVGLSCALKNMKGVTGADTRKRMHRRGLHQTIAEMSKALPPYLSVADGTIGLEGMGPSVLGSPAHFGMVFASRDPVALDATVCRLFHWSEPQFVSLAAQMGVGTDDAERIDLVGEEVRIVEGVYEAPDKEFSPHPSVHVIDGSGCSGCLNNVWLGLQDLTSQLDYSDARVAALFGSGGTEEAKTIGVPLVGVGNCALHLGGQAVEVIKGCPPSRTEIMEAVRKWLEKLAAESPQPQGSAAPR